MSDDPKLTKADRAALRQRAQEDGVRLRISIDYGSGMLKLAGQRLKGSKTAPHSAEVDKIRFSQGRREVAQRLLLHYKTGSCLDDGRLFCDRDLDEFLVGNSEQLDKVLELWKLCLCKKYQETAQAQSVWAVLDPEARVNVPAVHDLIVQHMKWIRGRVLDFYARGYALQLSQHEARVYWRYVPTECIATIPCMWDVEAQGIMRNACAAAGFTKVNLRLEPLCAAAASMKQFYRQDELTYGDCLCYVDIGCGTVDIATVAMLAPIGGKPRFIEVGDHTGDLAGAQVVNDLIWKHISDPENLWGACDDIEQEGGLQAVLHKLGGMTTFEFQRHCHDEIEARKTHRRSFPNGGAFDLVISARDGWDAIEGGIPKLNIKIDRAILQRIYGEWADRIKEAIDEHMSQSALQQSLTSDARQPCKGVVLTGGGAQSVFIQDQLEAYLDKKFRLRMFECPIENPVAEGALQQYPETQRGVLPTGYWWIARQEDWQAEIQEEPSAKCTEQFRLVRLMEYHAEGGLVFFRVPMLFLLEEDRDHRITFNMYHSNAAINPNRPLMDRRGRVLEGLTQWPPQYVDLPDPEASGFKPSTLYGGRKCFELKAIVQLSGTESHLNFHAVLLGPDGDFLFVDSQEDQDAELRPVSEHDTIPDLAVTKELWDADKPHDVFDRTQRVLGKRPAPAEPAAPPPRRSLQSDIAAHAPNPESSLRSSGRVEPISGPSAPVAPMAAPRMPTEHPSDISCTLSDSSFASDREKQKSKKRKKEMKEGQKGKEQKEKEQKEMEQGQKEKEQKEKEQKVKQQKEKEQKEKEQKYKEQKEMEQGQKEKEQKEKEQKVKQQKEKEQKEKEQKYKEQKEKQQKEKEQKEKQQKEKEQKEKQQKEKEQKEKEQKYKEQKEKQQRYKEQKEKGAKGKGKEGKGGKGAEGKGKEGKGKEGKG